MRARLPAAGALLLPVAAILVGLLLMAAERREDGRDRPSASGESDRDERLRALPYTAWARADGEAHGAGVSRYVPGSAFDGLNLFALTSRSEAWLVDMHGTRVHAWASERGQPDPEQDLPSFFRGWQDVAVDGEGALYALVSRDRILKLDAGSRLVWEVRLRAHHQVSLGPDGSLYTLTDELRLVEEEGKSRLVFDNDVVRIDRDGRVSLRMSLLDVLRSDAALASRLRAEIRSRFALLDARGLRGTLEKMAALPGESDARALLASPRLPEVERAFGGVIPADPDRELVALLRSVPGSPLDVLHANSVRVLDGAKPGLGRRGNLVVSLREMDLVAVVDPGARRVRWSWGPGVIEGQHDASVTSNGDLLVFDNRPFRGASRVLEVAPATGGIVWSQEGFFSPTRGGGQALPNGNVLIVESERGRAFEVTRAGATVWEYYDPDEADGRRLTLQQLRRIGGEEAARLRRALASR